MNDSVGLASSDDEIRDCHAVMAQLRPHLAADGWVARVRRQQAGGYLLARAVARGRVVAVAGFRISENLAWGKFLYVDDLVTLEQARSDGHGQALMDWLVGHAREAECDELHLDSGVQRFGAHRFYLRFGFDITSHHFRIDLRRGD